MIDGKRIWKADVRAETKAVTLTLRLARGPISLIPWSEGKLAKQGYVPVGDDPGCRDLVITGPDVRR